jgi:glutaredoxin
LIVELGHSGNVTATGRRHNSGAASGAARAAKLVAVTRVPDRPQVRLLTRDGCSICRRVHARLGDLADELGFELSVTDVDAAAAAGNPELRAEFGDRLPVILLDGREHSYWEIDEARLRADVAR